MRILTSAAIFASLIFFTVACTNNTGTGSDGLSCSADYNCDTGQVCYQSKCTAKDKVPKDTKDAGDTKDGGDNTPDKTDPKDEKGTPDKTEPKDEPAPRSEYPKGPYGADVGEVMIPIEIKDCEGKVMSTKMLFKNTKAKVIYLSVHTGWCPSCKTQSRTLEPLHKQYGNKGLVIWNILTEDTRAGSGIVPKSYCYSHAKEYGFTFPQYTDEGTREMRKFFDRNAVPLSMLITVKDMKIQYKRAGGLPDSSMQVILKTLLGQ
jgi:thiol-disulfide isomerase/thioredoxin